MKALLGLVLYDGFWPISEVHDLAGLSDRNGTSTIKKREWRFGVASVAK